MVALKVGSVDSDTLVLITQAYTSHCERTRFRVSGISSDVVLFFVLIDSLMNGFILVVFTEKPALQIPLFFLFLVTHMITMLGNLGLIILTVLSSHLHTPMYFFLFNLSSIDLCYSFVITLKMLMNFILSKHIVFYMWLRSTFFFVVSECCVLI
jgi:hypothetical protein